MTNASLYLWVALFGLIIGSFLNVVILRDGERLSIAQGRSRCPNCRHQLGFFDLIPLFSFLGLGGRCRYCKKSISWQYPLVEAFTSLLAVFCFWYGFEQKESGLLAIGLFIAFCLMTVVSVIDIRTQEVPVEYCTAAGLIGALSMVLSGQITWLQSLIGLVIGVGVVLLIALVWRLIRHEEGMGSGDSWILGASGALLGFPAVLVCFAVAIFTGSIVGGLVSLGSGKGLKLSLPFGPFLFAGTLAALVWGPGIIAWYTQGL